MNLFKLPRVFLRLQNNRCSHKLRISCGGAKQTCLTHSTPLPCPSHNSIVVAPAHIPRVRRVGKRRRRRRRFVGRCIGRIQAQFTTRRRRREEIRSRELMRRSGRSMHSRTSRSQLNLCFSTRCTGVTLLAGTSGINMRYFHLWTTVVGRRISQTILGTWSSGLNRVSCC